PITDYSEKELKENILEGFFVSPAIPEVRDYIVSIIEDILSKYPVDGIHMDFIRYPYSGYNPNSKKYYSDFGYNPIARKIFKQKYGFDPIRINRFADSPQKRLFDDFRSEQITDLVKRVNHAVKQKNSELIVSAAVMPFDCSKKIYFQDWPDWLRKGLID